MIDESIISFPGTRLNCSVFLRGRLVTRRDALLSSSRRRTPDKGWLAPPVRCAGARRLAAEGFPCLRFDYTGMGDSAGPKPDFEDAGDDIRRACDAVLAAVPGCERVALWGLCEEPPLPCFVRETMSG